MKKSSKLIIIFSIAIILFGMSDVYNYLTIGKEVLTHYQEISAIKQLVNYSLTQGMLKIFLGLVPITIIIFRNKS